MQGPYSKGQKKHCQVQRCKKYLCFVVASSTLLEWTLCIASVTRIQKHQGSKGERWGEKGTFGNCQKLLFFLFSNLYYTVIDVWWSISFLHFWQTTERSCSWLTLLKWLSNEQMFRSLASCGLSCIERHFVSHFAEPKFLYGHAFCLCMLGYSSDIGNDVFKACCQLNNLSLSFFPPKYVTK